MHTKETKNDIDLRSTTLTILCIIGCIVSTVAGCQHTIRRQRERAQAKAQQSQNATALETIINSTPKPELSAVQHVQAEEIKALIQTNAVNSL